MGHVCVSSRIRFVRIGPLDTNSVVLASKFKEGVVVNLGSREEGVEEHLIMFHGQ